MFSALSRFLKTILVCFFFAGDIKVDIVNGKGESISKLPGDRGKRLLVEMKVICHGKCYCSYRTIP